jgi:chemotaxis protein MotB
MAVRGNRRGQQSDHTWPGFVDALSSLLLVIIFLLSVFVLAQFFLGQALSGRDAALERLNAQVMELGDLLRLEQTANADLRREAIELSASLSRSNLANDELSGQISNLENQLAASQSRLSDALTAGAATEARLQDTIKQLASSTGELDNERLRAAAALEAVEKLNQNLRAMREQLARLEAALQSSEARDMEQQAVIVDLGRRLNVALAGKVEELAQYRSEFFGRMRALIAARPDIKIQGDRFVFQAEFLFASGDANLGYEGQEDLAVFAYSLLSIAAGIPPEMDWVLRVDGHTDNVPIKTAKYPSNWELSTARAVSVVKFLIEMGVPAERLVAAGFGEHQPLDASDTATAHSVNRRIEMRLTQR